MTMSIIVSLHPMVHAMEVMVWMMHSAIRADWMMIVVPVATIPIQVWIDVMIWSPPYWPIVPIVRGMPTYP
jgi:ABC-type cobalamin transport system permease subunit